MLTLMDIFIFFSFIVILVALLLENDDNKKTVLKIQAYASIFALTIEVVSLVARFLLSRYWLPVLIVLTFHATISLGIILDAKDYGVFERKKKTNRNVDVDVVV